MVQAPWPNAGHSESARENQFFFVKKKWFSGIFSAFYGQHSDTKAWTNPSPWSNFSSFYVYFFSPTSGKLPKLKLLAPINLSLIKCACQNEHVPGHVCPRARNFWRSVSTQTYLDAYTMLPTTDFGYLMYRMEINARIDELILSNLIFSIWSV